MISLSQAGIAPRQPH